MKRQLTLLIITFIFLTNLISAYYYNPSSIGDVLDSIGGENLGLISVFIISFIIISLSLNKSGLFKEMKGASVVLALTLSLLITYFGIYKTGLEIDVAEWFYMLGFSDSALDIFISLGLLGLGIFLIINLKSNAILIIGVFFLILAMADTLSETNTLLYLGIGLMLLWAIIRFATKEPREGSGRRYRPSTI